MSASQRARMGSQRLGVNERERVGGERVGIGERSSGERLAGGEPAPSDTYRLGERRGTYDGTYDYVQSAEVGRIDRGAIAWCEMQFRSFDPATGTYMGFDGIRHACP